MPKKEKRNKGRDKFRGFRCSDEIWAEFVAASEASGKPVSEIVRVGGLAYARRILTQASLKKNGR